MMPGSNPSNPLGTAAARLVLPIATMLLLLGCGSSAGSATPSSPAAQPPAASTAPGGAPSQAPAQPSDPAEPTDAASQPGGGDVPSGPIGGDVGDRSKGSVQARISGGLTASVDLPFAAALAQLLTQGPGTAYLPFTDVTNGTLFLTISGEGQLLVQYAGPGNVGLTNGATPCDLKLDVLDSGQAKGTFTCNGMLLVKGETLGSADMTGSFEAHR